MTRDDIIRMALEAGFEAEVGDVWISEGYWADELELFAALVAAAEREACAQVCDDSATPRNDAYQASYILKNCAAAIRARSQE